MHIKFSYLFTEQTLPASLAGTSGAGSGCSNKQNAGSPDLQRSGVFLGRNRLQILDLALILNEYSFFKQIDTYRFETHVNGENVVSER